MHSPGNDESRIYGFGPFILNGAERTLRHAGRTVHLTPKVLDTLLILVERRGQLVRKDELMEALWPDSYVEERNLTQNIFLLRKALGGGESGRQYIYTVPKVGYRFTAEVWEVEEEAPRGAPAVASPPEGAARQRGRLRTYVYFTLLLLLLAVAGALGAGILAQVFWDAAARPVRPRPAAVVRL